MEVIANEVIARRIRDMMNMPVPELADEPPQRNWLVRWFIRRRIRNEFEQRRKSRLHAMHVLCGLHEADQVAVICQRVASAGWIAQVNLDIADVAMRNVDAARDPGQQLKGGIFLITADMADSTIEVLTKLFVKDHAACRQLAQSLDRHADKLEREKPCG